ncbi:MAG: Fur family transcriptional regulator, partial [bacterium]
HWWRSRFQGAGLRLTLPRLAILKILTETTEHLSAEEIYLALRNRCPNEAIGLTTVYRTLEILVRMGIVYKFDFGDGRARYELSEGPDTLRHHHHLVCTGCGRIIDYTDFIDEEKELLSRTEKGLSEKYHFKIRHHLIQFYGLCEECQRKQADELRA